MHTTGISKIRATIFDGQSYTVGGKCGQIHALFICRMVPGVKLKLVKVFKQL
jgi:hypothetical protein